MRRAGLFAIAGGIAVLISLAGCTGVGGSPSTGPTSARPRTPDFSLPPSIANNPKLHHDVIMKSCAATKGGWAAGGSIVNTSSKGRDYTITVLFTSSQATAIGIGKTRVHVDPGADGDWQIKARFAPASPTLCVLSGVA